ncbi:MAG: cytochrome c3 family protein [Mariprofundaceae bacterium]
MKTKVDRKRRIRLLRAFSLLLATLSCVYLLVFPLSAATAGVSPLSVNDPLSIKCSKHDFTCLNERAGVVAMEGLAYADYGDTCVYCHIPAHAAESGSVDTEVLGGVPGWNRYKPSLGAYQLYGEPSTTDGYYQSGSWTFDSKVQSLSPISLLCLSCHDGTLGVDQVIYKPKTWKPEEDFSLHMRMNTDGDLTSCARCHNGEVAHDGSVKYLGQNLKNDHPISIMYLGLVRPDIDYGYWEPDLGKEGFSEGVKLFNGFVECATCHDVHDPSRELLLRVDPERICLTCHVK